MSSNPWSAPLPPTMLHFSSGRLNFNVIKPETNYSSIDSQREISSRSLETVRKQSHEAIKAATASNLPTPGRTIGNQSLIQHKHITCDGCSRSPIMGDRYKCMICSNIDFCEDCKSQTNGQHDSNHPLICIRDSSVYKSSVLLQNTSQLIHVNTRCVYCSASPIVGIRYQCTACNMNFCEKCEFLCLHDISHKRLKIILPE